MQRNWGLSVQMSRVIKSVLNLPWVIVTFLSSEYQMGSP